MTETSQDKDQPAQPGGDDVEPEAADAGGPDAGGDGAQGGNAGSRSSIVAWIALLLAIAAMLASGWLLFDDLSGDRTVSRMRESVTMLTSRVDESAQSVGRLDEAVAALEDTVDDVDARLGALRRQFDERSDNLDSMAARMASLERSVSALRGISAGTRDTWLLAEAEYYLEVANTELQLARNPELATRALRMADDRLKQVGKPGLTAVRAAIADELARLDAINRPDVEGIALTLSSLAQVVEALPVRRIDRAGVDDTDVDTAPSGFGRAWASVKDAFSGLVRVTRPEERDAPLMTPDAERLLRSNLALQLQAARLALLRGEQALFEQSLDDAGAWLTSYFEAGNAQVESALETIAELREAEIRTRTPDISESLELLRTFIASRESAE